MAHATLRRGSQPNRMGVAVLQPAVPTCEYSSRTAHGIMGIFSIRPVRPGCALCREAGPAVTYAVAYLGYLWIHPESEAWHWISLVALPVALVIAMRKRLSGVFASFGMKRSNWRNHLGVAIAAGTVLSGLNLFLGGRGPAALEVLSTPQGWLLLPVALGFLLLTAGLTEEIFFRGFLQTRIETRFGSPWVAIGIVTLLFSVYHVPYAYLNPNWPSAGDLPAAIQSAFVQGIPGGLILGWLYLRSDRNLFACVALHSLINWFPALTMIRMGGQ